MDDEESALYLVIAALGVPAAAAGFIEGDVLGVGPTLGLAAVAVGILGLAARCVRRVRLPAARARRRR